MNSEKKELSKKVQKLDWAFLEGMALEEGSVEAMVELAQRCRSAGDILLSEQWISRAQLSLVDDDSDGLADIWWAISVAGLGKFDYQEREKIAHGYLTQLADRNNLFAQETLMLDYLEGLNGIEKDSEKFKYWAERATALGSDLARVELRKFSRI